MNSESKITLHAVSSLDGFIAKNDGSMDWLESTWTTYDKGIVEEDTEEFLKTIHCYIIGSHTFELALTLGWPYGNTPTFVLTTRNLTSERENVRFFSGDLVKFVEEVLKPEYKNIWLAGGASLCQQFLNLSLVDEIRLTIIPILLGSGISLFSNLKEELKLDLKDVTAYKNGLLELCYGVQR